MCADALGFILIRRTCKGRTRACYALSSISMHWVDLNKYNNNNNVTTDDIFTSDFVHAHGGELQVCHLIYHAQTANRGTVVTLKGGSSDY